MLTAQHALTVTQTGVVMPATRYSKDDSSNSMNTSNSRTSKTVGTTATAGMLAKVMKPATAFREDNNYMELDTNNIRDGSSSSSRGEASNIQHFDIAKF
jgi:hypothetical protein